MPCPVCALHACICQLRVRKAARSSDCGYSISCNTVVSVSNDLLLIALRSRAPQECLVCLQRSASLHQLAAMKKSKERDGNRFSHITAASYSAFLVSPLLEVLRIVRLCSPRLFACHSSQRPRSERRFPQSDLSRMVLDCSDLLHPLIEHNEELVHSLLNIRTAIASRTPINTYICAESIRYTIASLC